MIFSSNLCPHRQLFRVAYEMATMFAEGVCEDTDAGVLTPKNFSAACVLTGSYA